MKLSKFIFLMLLPMVASAVDVLPVEQAFKPNVKVLDNLIEVNFEIAEGYYLYRHAFAFQGQGFEIEQQKIIFPQGKRKQDEYFGEVESYRHSMSIKLPYQSHQAAGSLQIKYQGCADAGICYPPERSSFDLKNLQTQPPATSLGDGAINLANENFAIGGQRPLSAEQAFKVEAIALDDVNLNVRFSMPEHIYLYKNKLEFLSLSPEVKLQAANFPPSKPKDDPEFGLVEVFYDVAEVVLPITRSAAGKQIELEVSFQGCEDGKVCYPPQSRLLTVMLPPLTTAVAQMSAKPANLVANNEVLSEQQQLTKGLEKNPLWLILLQFLSFGLMLSLTPCVFPMIPILSGLIVGQKNPSTARAFSMSLVYVLAMAVAYTVVGVVAGLAGTNLQAMFQKPLIIVAFSAIFVFLAFSMFGFYELQLPSKWQNKLMNISNRQQGGSLLGVAVMGLLSALIVGPCVAPPLAAAVIYISSSQNGAFIGGLALFMMSFGMGLPLLLIGASAGKWMPNSGGWMNLVKSFFGIALIGMAVWFISRIIDDNITLYLWSALLIFGGFMWHAHAQRSGVSAMAMSFFDAVRWLSILIGSLLLLAALAGGTRVTRPFDGLFVASEQQSAKQLSFAKVKTVEQLEQAIEQSELPILLDFYADWCVECKHMAKTTFKNPQIIQLANGFTRLKADVTANDELDKELMQRFNIVGPPAMLFFDKNGNQLTEHHFFGYKSAAELKQVFEKILN